MTTDDQQGQSDAAHGDPTTGENPPQPTAAAPALPSALQPDPLIAATISNLGNALLDQLVTQFGKMELTQGEAVDAALAAETIAECMLSIPGASADQKLNLQDRVQRAESTLTQIYVTEKLRIAQGYEQTRATLRNSIVTVLRFTISTGLQYLLPALPKA